MATICNILKFGNCYFELANFIFMIFINFKGVYMEIRQNSSITFGTKISKPLQERLDKYLNTKGNAHLRNGIQSKLDELTTNGNDIFEMTISKDRRTGKEILALKHIDPKYRGESPIQILGKRNLLSTFLSIGNHEIKRAESGF